MAKKVLWHEDILKQNLHCFIELEKYGKLKSFLTEVAQISTVLWHDNASGGSAVVEPRLLIPRSRVWVPMMAPGEENSEKSFMVRRHLEAKAALFHRTGKMVYLSKSKDWTVLWDQFWFESSSLKLV
jgi:hypothetical protein